jgi:peptide deformylase
MANRTVIRMGHPTLKKVADQLTKDEILSQETRELIQDLY